jgi:hypothetical protein
MELKLRWISSEYVEVNVDEIETGTLNTKEAKELAKNLIDVASELLTVEDI